MAFVVGMGVQSFGGTFDTIGKAFTEELGVHSIRLSVGHGQTDARHTEDINWAFARGIGVLLFLGYSGGDTPTGDPRIAANRQAYANRSGNYAAQYAGKVQYFEVWNEWNGGLGLGRYPECLPACNDAVMYTDLLKRCYIAIKAKNPNALVVGGCTSSVHLSFVGRMLDAGAGDFMDLLSVHPYPYFQSAVQFKVPHGTSAVVAANKFGEAVAAQRAQLIQKTGRIIPIMVTEEGVQDHHVNNSQTLRAQYLTEIYSRGIAGQFPDLSGVYWYALEDYATGNYGVVHGNNVRKPAFFAYKDMAALDSPPDPPPPPPDPPPEGPFTLITFAGDRPLRTNYTGTLGTEFTVGATQIIAHELGWFDDGLNGNANAHQVGLWSSSPGGGSFGTLLGSVTIKTGTQSPLVGEFRWETLALDISLNPGETYRLGGNTFLGSIDAFRDAPLSGQVNITYSPGVSINNAVWSPEGTGFVFPSSLTSGAGKAYVGPNFRTGDEIPAGQLPDLTILEFSYANDGVFSTTVKNQGAGASPVGVAVRVNYYVNGTHRAFSDTTVGPIAAGATIIIGTSSSPFVIPEGTHDIEARVDETNTIVESDDTNNNFEFEIVIAAQDLLGWDGPFGTNTRKIWFGHPPWTIQGGA